MNIFRISRALALGRYPRSEEQQFLEAEGITHVVNVCETPTALALSPRLREIVWHPMNDWSVMPDAAALAALDDLHRLTCTSESRVYVHCRAGRQRAPTLLWLYAIACGWNRHVAARHMIERAPETMPGHAAIVDDRLVGMIEAYGKEAFQPHPRPDAWGD